MKIKAPLGERVFRVFNCVFLGLIGFVCLYPMWHVLMASFSDSTALTAHSGLLLWPIDFSLDAYKRVLTNRNIWTGYWNTIKFLVLGVSTSMVMTTLGAYVLSRRDFMLRRPIMLAITFTMFFSGGTIPTYLNIQELKLTGSIWGLVLPFCIATYNMIILRTAFESMPESLLEAARLDGAGQLDCLIRIVLPLNKATLSVIALYYGVSCWNAWFWASQILESKTKMPLAVILRDILINADMQQMDNGVTNMEGIKYATIIVATVPILCVYPFIQKYFAQGVMIGAVKE